MIISAGSKPDDGIALALVYFTKIDLRDPTSPHLSNVILRCSKDLGVLLAFNQNQLRHPDSLSYGEKNSVP